MSPGHPRTYGSWSPGDDETARSSRTAATYEPLICDNGEKTESRRAQTLDSLRKGDQTRLVAKTVDGWVGVGFSEVSSQKIRRLDRHRPRS